MATAGPQLQQLAGTGSDTAAGDAAQGSAKQQTASALLSVPSSRPGSKRTSRQVKAAAGETKTPIPAIKEKTIKKLSPGTLAPRPRSSLLDSLSPATQALLKPAAIKEGGIPKPPAVAMSRKGSSNKKETPVSASAAVRARLAAINASPEQFAMNRSGRQFTVGNIGTGGAIYLRPVMRPGSEVFQKSPLGGIDIPPPVPEKDKPYARRLKRVSSFGQASVLSSSFTELRPDLLPRSRRSSLEIPRQSGISKRRPGRALSYSSVDDRLSRKSSFSQPGNTFKVVIKRPASRKRTVRAAEVPGIPPLDSLPSPKFGQHLDAADAHITTGNRDTGTTSEQIIPSSELEHSGEGEIIDGTQVRSPVSLFQKKQDSTDVLIPRAKALDSTPRQSNIGLALHIFDDLSTRFNDPSVVRFAPKSDEILAATPSRLIAHITSPSFLDYELLSDFFLTFRQFLQTDDLATFLVARLRWAVDRQDDAGKIVRVRTFVALRHWILNYFADDFAPDFALRCHFCDLVNDLFHDLQIREDGGGGDIKVIGELKKCWRRTCALYWPKSGHLRALDDDIFPGGRYESITLEDDEDIDTSFLQAEPDVSKTLAAKKRHSRRSALGHGPHSDSRQVISPMTLASPTHDIKTSSPNLDVPTSPRSIQSMHIISCSLPFKQMNKSDNGSEASYPHPHPVPLTGNLSTAPITSHSRNQVHRRNTSLDSNLIDHNYIEDLIPAGSLIHGALYQPTTPYFEWRSHEKNTSAPGSSYGENRPSSLGYGPGSLKGQSSTSIEQERGMKKLFGSMRRALGGGRSSTGVNTAVNADEKHMTNSDMQSGQHSSQTKVQVRMDLLCSWAAEEFKIAMEQEMGDDEEDSPNQPRDTGKKRAGEGLEVPRESARYPIHRSVTVGSRSIVIFDDTNGHPSLPMMSGAIRPDSGIGAAVDQMENDDNVEERSIDDHLSAVSPLRERSPRISGETDISALAAEFNRLHPPRQPIAHGGAYVPSGAVAAGVYVPSGYKDGMPSTRQPMRRSSIATISTSGAAEESAQRLRKYASFHSGFMNSTHTSMVPPLDSASMLSVPRSPLLPLSQELEFDHDHAESSAEPTRQLRRRPGGDLKAVSKANELGKRRYSLPSMSTPSHSVQTSVISPVSPRTNERVSKSKLKTSSARIEKRETAVDEKRSQKSASATTPSRRRRGKSISLIATHSSQPNLRPSFEAEVAKLKALPDDDEDDGGVHATLLKLEGKYERKSPNIPAEPEHRPRKAKGKAKTKPKPKPKEEDVQDGEKHKRHHEHVQDIHPEHGLPSPVNNVENYRSTPLLERKKSDRNQEHELQFKDNIISVEALLQHADTINSSVEKLAIAQDKAQQERKSRKMLEPVMSFLLDDQQSLSENEMVGQRDDISEVRSFFDDRDSNKSLRNVGTPSIAATLGLDSSRPPTRGIVGTALSPSSGDMALPVISGNGSTTFLRGLPTPTGSPKLAPISPTRMNVDKPLPDPMKRNKRRSPPEIMFGDNASHTGMNLPTPRQSIIHPTHLPFIMAYDADLLAKQFTIVERDALDELDWRELIDLRWNQSPPGVQDWVTYLRSTEGAIGGVGLVIARFNLMVKWVLSELLLTNDHAERARVMVHFIRIACAARKLRNFATMYQIAVALLSADAARLKKAWALVPVAEHENLRDLERVVQPLKNFHNLRIEMETAPAEAGCVPFIGIYTRDLVYNAQKPGLFTSRRHPDMKKLPTRLGTSKDEGTELPMMVMGEGEPMVNFERQHNAANIVKTLLRLLEQSQNYKFTPEPAVLSRCLWVATVGESEIKERVAKAE